MEIFHPRQSLKEREKAYKKFKNIIFALKPIFKEIVYERNRIFKEEGDKNYFDFINRRNGIPPEKLALFRASEYPAFPKAGMNEARNAAFPAKREPFL